MLYYPDNARTEDQRSEMIRLEAAASCLFCPEGLVENGREIVVANETWSVMRNEYPYPGTLHHLLLLPQEHVTKMTDLSVASQQGFWDILKSAEELFGPDYFVLGVRNGEMSGTGSTIAHLHVQFIVSDPNHTGEPPKLYAGSFPAT